VTIVPGMNVYGVSLDLPGQPFGVVAIYGEDSCPDLRVRNGAGEESDTYSEWVFSTLEAFEAWKEKEIV